jgi:thioredoxin-dependent peroxiredoxin
MTYPKLGSKAPAFVLKNQRGDSVSLADFKGKNLILYFYPKALTPGCTVQACGVRDTKSELDELNAVVLGVSPDTPEKLAKFTQKYDLNFDLLADEDHTLAEAYGVWGMKKFMGKEYMGIIRTTFIISPEGKLIGVLDDFQTKTHHQVLVDWLNAHAKV